MAGTALLFAACELHGTTHRSPANLTVERHHLIPVGWQQTWQPPQPWPFPGRDQDGRGALWDARTVGCAPTCHRNVHHWIVALMTAVKQGASFADAAAIIGAQRVTARRKAVLMPEFVCARLALAHFVAAGGDLAVLVAAGELGAA